MSDSTGEEPEKKWHSILELLKDPKEVYTVSNLISMVRVVIILPILILLMYRTWWANLSLSILVVIGILSDALDGYFARRLNQITNLGLMLDPVADKIALVFGGLGLVFIRDYPGYVIFTLFGRDILIFLGSLLVVKRKMFVIPSNFYGKLATVVLSLSLFTWIIEFPEPYFRYLAPLSFVFIIISGINNVARFFRTMGNELPQRRVPGEAPSDQKDGGKLGKRLEGKHDGKRVENPGREKITGRSNTRTHRKKSEGRESRKAEAK